ncbi:MAG TPA: hypothetical protein DCZ74_07660 [Treponema sp.]|jgi:hypothetical protein|nr:hypothetical protein [Treponema sp.]
MAIPTERRAEFAEKSKAVKAQIDNSLKKEKSLLDSIRQNNSGMEYKKMLLGEEMIYIATLYMSINAYSLSIMETKNNEALNDARKTIYKALIYFEEVVSNTVDCPYNEIAPRVEKIENIPIDKRFYLMRKMGLVIQMLYDALGENSKWKWSFVEIRARFAVVSKNLVDMKQAGKDYFEPSSQDYDTTVYYVRMIRKLLDKSSMDYRDKYELSTRSEADMQMAINLLIALRRIAMILGDSDESEEIRKKALVWKTKMESDQKQQKH